MAGRILIVDPVATNRIILKVKLSAARYDICLASGFSEALITSAAQAPDLIIVGLSASDASASDAARATAIGGLKRIRTDIRRRLPTNAASSSREHLGATLDEIERFLKRPHESVRPKTSIDAPPGSPIGR